MLGHSFAIQVQMGAGQGQHGIPRWRLGAITMSIAIAMTVGKPQITQQIEHQCGTVLARLQQGQTGQGAHLQLKLRDIAGVLAIVAAIVRARGNLIDDQTAVFEHKKLDAQHAHIVQTLRHRFCCRHGLRGQCGGQIACVNFGHGQDTIAVQIALHRQIDHCAISTTRHNHRALQRQRQHFFKHARHAP